MSGCLCGFWLVFFDVCVYSGGCAGFGVCLLVSHVISVVSWCKQLRSRNFTVMEIYTSDEPSQLIDRLQHYITLVNFLENWL